MRKPEYIAQESGGNCGAAALSMVLGQFDWNEPPQKIAQLLASVGPNGLPSIKTHQLANHARSLGFSSMVVQFSDPLKALARCHQAGFGVIINHRLDKEKPTGHFSVLSGLKLADGLVSLHDPQNGPDLWITTRDLLELWSPLVAGSQIAGMVGVVIGPRPMGGVSCICPSCSQDYDETAPAKCGGCSIVMEPLPGFELGCLAESCAGRLWRKIFCPNCDRAWSGQRLTQKKQRPLGPRTEPEPESPAQPAQAAADTAQPSDQPAVPQVDLSTSRLADALKSIPLPDWGVIAALAESQKQTLLELADATNLAQDLRERARDWDQAADEVRLESTRLAASREGLAAELKASSEALKAEPAPAEPAPAADAEPAGEPPAETPAAKPPLPSGVELVAKLMALAKERG